MPSTTALPARLRAPRRVLLAVAVLVVAAAACVPLAGPEHDAFVLLNQVRADNGVGAVAPDEMLQDRARDWVVELGEEGTIRHSGLRAEDVSGATVVAENVAVASSLNAAVEALVESPSHFDNMVDGRFTRGGMAAVTGQDGRTYVVQVFAD
jgi:uncharacterized protein YkwD